MDRRGWKMWRLKITHWSPVHTHIIPRSLPTSTHRCFLLNRSEKSCETHYIALKGQMIIVPELCFNILRIKKLLSANSEDSTLYKRGSVRVCACVCNHAFLTVQECTCSCVRLYRPLSRMSLNVYQKCWESYTTRLSVLPNCFGTTGKDYMAAVGYWELCKLCDIK